jgi:hypothetical protein
MGTRVYRDTSNVSVPCEFYPQFMQSPALKPQVLYEEKIHFMDLIGCLSWKAEYG